MKAFKKFDSPIGAIFIAEDEGYITQISLAGKPLDAYEQDTELLSGAYKQLGEYFTGKRKRFELPVLLRGSDFQNRVWKALMDIPYGSAMSYSQVAAAIGMPMAARAVGGACSANPLLIAVPCHRVLRNDGGLGGFAVGLEPKRYLLNLEGIHWLKGGVAARDGKEAK